MVVQEVDQAWERGEIGLGDLGWILTPIPDPTSILHGLFRFVPVKSPIELAGT